ncbi:uncharacterized protein LOC143910409 [Arctopsyche grandis]|uniref:uncharacterized protein LOC143910409 n=1 Tax=Arctopsyche grandis TaxID=121162 RepID=UPI00406D93A2
MIMNIIEPRLSCTLVLTKLLQSNKCGWSNAHEIVELVVPAIADPRENAILSCRYDMGKDHLYSAKWFKDEQELFRYMPAQKPPGLPFPVHGIKLAGTPKCSQVACDLELMELQPSSAGVYRCEVVTEAPTFRLVHRNASMIVAELV